MAVSLTEFEAQRLTLHKTVLVQVERRVEDLEQEYKDLAHEVDNIDFEPNYTCDCSCDGDIQDLYKVLEEQQKTMELLTARILGLEAKLLMEQ